MRIWLSGPRMLGGLVRPGVSFGPEDFRKLRRPSPPLAPAAPLKSHPWLTLLAVVAWGYLIWLASPFIIPAMILLAR